jgi:hypothetical protein
VKNPNCSTITMVPTLAALEQFGIERVHVDTLVERGQRDGISVVCRSDGGDDGIPEGFVVIYVVELVDRFRGMNSAVNRAIRIGDFTHGIASSGRKNEQHYRARSFEVGHPEAT